MRGWLESMAGAEYASALMWTVVALIALLVLLIIIRIARSLTFGTFVAGGRNRKARLAVMDATAVDSHRRLVLVRRDDVEHLILIGGPSDVVVEQNIRLLPLARRQAIDELRDHEHATTASPDLRQRAQPVSAPSSPSPSQAATPPRQPAREPQPTAAHPVAPIPQPAVPSQQHATTPAAEPTAAAPTPRSEPERRPEPIVPPKFEFQRELRPAAPVSQPPAQQEAQPAPRPQSLAPTIAAPAAIAAGSALAQPNGIIEPERPVEIEPAASEEHGIDEPDLNEALLEELEVTLESDRTKQTATEEAASEEDSLDEEMSRLLNELSGHNR